MSITVGSLFVDALRLLLRGFPRWLTFALFFGVSLATLIIPLCVALDVPVQSLQGPGAGDAPFEVALIWGVIVLYAVPYGTGLVYHYYELLHDRSPSALATLRYGFVRSPPAFALTFFVFLCVALFGLLISLSTTLLLEISDATQGLSANLWLIGIFVALVCGAMLICTYLLIPAACVIEGRVTSAFSRSAELTKSRRLILFTTLVLMLLFATGVSYGLEFGMAPIGSALRSIESEGTYRLLVWFASVLSMLGMLFLWSLQLLLPTVAYVRLRQRREGGETEGVASVFR